MVILSVNTETTSRKDAEDGVDADITEFNQFFIEKLGNSPLTRAEKAVIKTYLWWKLFESNTTKDGGWSPTEDGAKKEMQP